MASALPLEGAVWELPQRLGLTSDIVRLQETLARWANECDPEVREMVQRQLGGRAKYFRPVTLFACHRSIRSEAPPPVVLLGAAAVEITHNVTLIVDDILDRSRFRRGQLSLHCRYGFLPALMTSGYMTVAAYDLVAADAYSVHVLAELLQRLGAAECRQWRLRRQPLGVEDWREIAGEDTGSMFEVCAALGTRDASLRRFGRLLGILYHGCDDVADVRGTAALGGGEKDIEDGIVTLPAALAVRDPETAVLFREGSGAGVGELTRRLAAVLPEAEAYLDTVAADAAAEAVAHAAHPERLLELVRHTRALSRS
jgi:geranylgeranyl pyrophosphate synthase